MNDNASVTRFILDRARAEGSVRVWPIGAASVGSKGEAIAEIAAMKQAGAVVKVAKNRLAKLALDGTDAAVVVPLLKGPTLIAYSGDPIAAPKAAADFAKGNEKFVILGGAMGKLALDANGVRALAALPSLDELRAKIIGLIQAPATKVAQLLNAPGAKVARVVQAYASKGEAA